MRTPVIAGNWKMYKTSEEATEFMLDLKKQPLPTAVEMILFPAYLSLPALQPHTAGTGIHLGVQNVHWEEEGAYTGEISIPMVKAMEVTYVLIGHSERRQYFAETDETVNWKIRASLKAGITPVLCVGETLVEREEKRTEAVITRQIEAGLRGLTRAEAEKVLIAYEPVWAIGTGKAASAYDADLVIGRIRTQLAQLYGKEIAEKIRLLYGGSVKPDNLHSFLQKHSIDGALVGSASLQSSSFYELLKVAEEYR